jgi:hypothetical protein
MWQSLFGTDGNQGRALFLWLSLIFSENRHPLFGIML